MHGTTMSRCFPQAHAVIPVVMVISLKQHIQTLTSPRQCIAFGNVTLECTCVFCRCFFPVISNSNDTCEFRYKLIGTSDWRQQMSMHQIRSPDCGKAEKSNNCGVSSKSIFERPITRPLATVHSLDSVQFPGTSYCLRRLSESRRVATTLNTKI